MKIARLVFNPIQENTYIIWDSTLEAAIIDAGESSERECEIIDKFIAERGLKPTLAINTHGHFDHLMGVEHLQRKYGVRFALSSKDEFLLKGASVSAELFGVRAGDMPETIDIDLDGLESISFGTSSSCTCYNFFGVTVSLTISFAALRASLRFSTGCICPIVITRWIEH